MYFTDKLAFLQLTITVVSISFWMHVKSWHIIYNQFRRSA